MLRSRLQSSRSRLVLILILLIAAVLRWYGLAWDAGYLFHPDERQILMVASNLDWPQSLSEFISPASPLNPHFFAYGTLPIYLLRALAPLTPPLALTGPWANDFLARWAVFARAIAGLFDLGTIVLVYALGRRLYSARAGLIAAACVAVTALHIQLAHFYTVDTLLTFFVVATLYAAWRMGEQAENGSGPRAGFRRWKVVCGVAFGLALASKVSALPLLVPISFAIWRASGRMLPASSWREQALTVWRVIRGPLGQVAVIAVITFVVTQPYAVIDLLEFGRAVIVEALVARGWVDFPYTRQYASTVPFAYQIIQSVVWGMGLPLGLFTWAGAGLLVFRTLRRRDAADLFVTLWALTYFLTIGAQYVKYPRYLLPLLPALYLMFAAVIEDLFQESVRTKTRRLQFGVWVGVLLILAISLAYSVAFVSIYGREHPWLAASRWIYEHVRPGGAIAVEEWDDALPVQLRLAGATRTGGEYHTLALPLQSKESPDMLQEMARELAHADVVIIASQRNYGSLGRLRSSYPVSARYYDLLFSGQLGYTLAATFRNEPMLFGLEIADDPRLGLPFDRPFAPSDSQPASWSWGFADESLTVYDHPQVFLFLNTQARTESELSDVLAPR